MVMSAPAICVMVGHLFQGCDIATVTTSLAKLPVRRARCSRASRKGWLGHGFERLPGPRHCLDVRRSNVFRLRAKQCRLSAHAAPIRLLVTAGEPVDLIERIRLGRAAEQRRRNTWAQMDLRQSLV